jgi:hypothetical protein
MKQAKRAVLLTLLAREMGKRGSWCGETHIQKATFLLQELLGVDIGLEFILYRHGPFSFELRDALSSMQADELLAVVVKQQGYGPTYVPTSFSESFLERFPKTVTRYSAQVEFIADQLGDMGVADLEKITTAFFIADRENVTDIEEQAKRLVELKPHISLTDARWAGRQVERLKDAIPFTTN